MTVYIALEKYKPTTTVFWKSIGEFYHDMTPAAAIKFAGVDCMVLKFENRAEVEEFLKIKRFTEDEIKSYISHEVSYV